MLQVSLQNGTAPSCLHLGSCMCEGCTENGFETTCSVHMGTSMYTAAALVVYRDHLVCFTSGTTLR
jgi:hypothetical protein